MLSNRILEQFLTQSDNGFVNVDSDYCIISANNAVLELSGYSIDELEGAALEFLFDTITADKICKIYNSFGCSEISHKICGDLLTKNAEPITVEVLINCSAAADDFSYWLLIKNKSINTERERRLKKSELMLHSAIESLPFDFWVNDTKNRTCLQNSHSKALWGDVKDRTPQEVPHKAKIIEHWLDSTARALKGEIVNGEISYIIDGKKKYFRNIIAPIQDAENMFGILGMNIDITDLKEAVVMRDMLLKEVHHRVKNNLQMIIGIIKLEESELCEGSDGCEALDDIIHRIEAVSMIHERLYQADINNIIHVSDYLRSLVEQIVEGHKIQNLELKFDLDEPEVETDKIILLGLIINELVTNSLKYAYNIEGRHSLELQIKENDDLIFLSLSDSGPGLPDGFKDKISKSLGMRMIYAFVQQLNGRLEWDSSTGGTTFNLSFPAKKTET